MISRIQEIRGRQGLIKIFRNIGWLFFDKVIRMALSLVVGIWVARYLGPSNFGILNYGIAFVALFTCFSTLGLDSILIREIIKKPEEKKYLLGTSIYLKIFAGIITYLLSVFISYFLNPKDPFETIVISILGIGLLTQAFDTIDYYFQSKLKVKFSVIAKTSAFILVSGLRIVLIIKQLPLIYFLWAIAIELVLGAIFLVLIYGYNCELNISNWKWNKKFAKSLLGDTWPLMLSSFAIMIYMRIDQIMIKQILGNSYVGLYSAAVRISEVYYFIPMTIASSIFPKLVELKNSSEESFLKRLSQFYSLMTVSSIVIATFITIFANNIINLLYGSAFSKSAEILSIQIWAGVFVFLGVAANQYLTIENLTKYSFYQTLIGAVVNVLLNVILIPLFGIVGASIATLFAYFCSAFLSNLFFSKTRIVFLMQLSSFNLFKHILRK